MNCIKTHALVLSFITFSTLSFSTEKPKSLNNQYIPDYSEYDWIQLNTDEWLKGELKEMFEDKLTFESEKLKTLEFDWEDIKVIYSSRNFMVGIEYQKDVVGKLLMSDNTVILQNNEEQLKYEKKEVLSLIRGAKKRSSYWAGKISIGANSSQGNLNQSDINTNIQFSRRTPDSRFTINYLANFSKIDSIETTNDHRVNFKYDIYKSKRFYWQPLFGEFYKDPFSNIDAKYSLGTGLGYTIVDKKSIEWSVSGGPSYLETTYDSVEPGQDQKEKSSALYISTDVDWDITEDIEFIGNYNAQWSKEDNGGYTHHILTMLEFELGSYVDLNLSIIWDYSQSLKNNEDGEEPEQNDTRYIIGFGFDF